MYILTYFVVDSRILIVPILPTKYKKVSFEDNFLENSQIKDAYLIKNSGIHKEIEK